MSHILTPTLLALLRTMHTDLRKWCYTRELARISRASKTTISDKFPKLAKHGILNQRLGGREVYYKLNLANPTTRKLCELFETERREEFYRRNRRIAWALQDFTKKVFEFLPQVQCVILFGSAARGQLTRTSDVDLLVVIPTMEQDQFSELMKSVDRLAAEVRGTYGLTVSAITMTMKDFEGAVREKKRIAEDVLREGIVLFGEERYYQLLSRVI